MRENSAHATQFRKKIESGDDLLEAFITTIGGRQVCGGVWRFYSHGWPEGGIETWNRNGLWRQEWNPFLPEGFFSFGEDVYGNQLVSLSEKDTIFLWDHETGKCFDLYSDLPTLFETVSKSGIGWIDFYNDGSLAIAENTHAVPVASHLHWIVPLFLGGTVSAENITMVERESHLLGHAKILSQIDG